MPATKYGIQCIKISIILINGVFRQARQTRLNSGLQRAIQDSTKGGGVAVIFYFLRDKNIIFLEFLR